MNNTEKKLSVYIIVSDSDNRILQACNDKATAEAFDYLYCELGIDTYITEVPMTTRENKTTLILAMGDAVKHLSAEDTVE